MDLVRVVWILVGWLGLEDDEARDGLERQVSSGMRAGPEMGLRWQLPRLTDP